MNFNFEIYKSKAGYNKSILQSTKSYYYCYCENGKIYILERNKKVDGGWGVSVRWKPFIFN